MTHGASGTWVLVLRGRRINLFLAQGRSRRLLLRMDLRDRVVATRAKAKVNHSGVGGTSVLIVSQGRCSVTIVTSLETKVGISLGDKDPRVMRHHSLRRQWDTHRHYLFLLILEWDKGTSVSPKARIGVEARTSRSILQRPRGVSTP